MTLLQTHIDPAAEQLRMQPKFKYVRAIDPRLNDLVASMALPYPASVV